MSGGFVSTEKIDFWNSGWRYMQFRSLYANVTMFCYFTTQNMSKKYRKKHYFCLLKKFFKNFFFSFYQLQQTPTWLVHKYSNHLPGFDMKNEIAASTNLGSCGSNHLPYHKLFCDFLYKMLFFIKHQKYFFLIAANTCLKSAWKQQPPTTEQVVAGFTYIWGRCLLLFSFQM